MWALFFWCIAAIGSLEKILALVDQLWNTTCIVINLQYDWYPKVPEINVHHFVAYVVAFIPNRGVIPLLF